MKTAHFNHGGHGEHGEGEARGGAEGAEGAEKMFDYDRPFYGVVKEGSWLFRLLTGVEKRGHRKTRWKAYYRACRKIPKTSPVYGTTSWLRLNRRRCQLIKEHLAVDAEKRIKSDEYHALQAVASELGMGGIIIQNFVMGRLLRRMNAYYEGVKP